MSKNTGYNGYHNYETWNICLWMDNEYSIYLETLRRLKREKFTPESAKEYANEMFPNGLTPDLEEIVRGGGSLDSINWQEVADNLNENEGA